MRIEKAVEVGGRQLRVIARTHARRDGEPVWRVRLHDGLYFRDLVVADSPSADEAVERAVTMYLGREGSTVMSKQKKTAKVPSKATKSAPKRAQGARGAKKTAKARQDTQAAPERDTAQKGAPRGEETQTAKKAGPSCPKSYLQANSQMIRPILEIHTHWDA
jgi:hypothetical protein